MEKPLLELKGKTLGLIGYGHIAQKVAKIGHAFSMKVISYNHRPKKVPESWIQQVSFDELLRQSDVLSLHVIQTPETIDLINNDTIAKMKNWVIILIIDPELRNVLMFSSIVPSLIIFVVFFCI
ncbi:NAD(P)-dependent oxidoreductase [Oenococcus oeni]|uniref:NAD(P)-dependent oxidoreductase n=2 Tax=Oenococcus oeni TaxID=1247 RepID=UPI0003123B00|nr:NAD(P)-dependent oxidoreductase [Oenococcus oeni]AZZ61216.1 hypothetical protein DSM07_07915 [Oenococcus sp. UCMA 16435]KZD12964.1 D-3-phosphoglycerate dehydrogenase [Oenococcus oeni]QGR00974.1 hypothetical protein E4R25_03325 [Oenococcus oeni]TEU23120.1 hypothetical protein E2147_04695 [Oenococcus oeni]TEU53590.1 hypothetical protein E2145_07090 [Oenococcus oeni]